MSVPGSGGPTPGILRDQVRPMSQSRLSFLLAGLVMGLTAVPMSAQTEVSPIKLVRGEFATSAQLRRGPVPLVVEGLGEFRIVRAQLRDDPGGSCVVPFPQLREALWEAYERSPGGFAAGNSVALTQDKGKCTAPNGTTVDCCVEEGNACGIVVSVDVMNPQVESARLRRTRGGGGGDSR